MTRDLHADVVTATGQTVFESVWLVSLAFDSGTLYLHTGVGDRSYGGNTYTGTGTLGEVSPVEESVEIRPNGVRLSLSGLNASLVSIALGEHYQGRTCTVLFAMIDAEGAIIGTPYTYHVGRIDTMLITDTGQFVKVELTSENRMVDFDNLNEVGYYTDVEQQALYPGDLGLQYIAAQSDKTIWWGRPHPGQGHGGGNTDTGGGGADSPGVVGDPGVPGGSGWMPPSEDESATLDPGQVLGPGDPGFEGGSSGGYNEDGEFVPFG